MLHEDFSDLPDLEKWRWKLKPVDTGFGTVRSLEKVSSTFVTHADLECVDSRYLLCGLSDGGVAIYDTSLIKEGRIYSEVAAVKGGQRQSHQYQVDCVQWYPADAGLFITSSRDKKVKIWDPNHMKTVDQYRIECHILHHCMSPVATKHSLLSVSGDSGEVILCDLRSGSSVHRLQGHVGPVQITQWSPRNQHILVSGGKDQTVRMWDVRAGRACLMALDMENSLCKTTKFKKRSKNVPQAHKSCITSLCFTHDGMWLLSFGYDGHLKLWNSTTGDNMEVKYEEAYTELKKTIHMAISYCTYPDLVFIPCREEILVFDLLSGRLLNVLQGHFLSVLGVVYNPVSMDLYSFGIDHNFITWTPKKLLKSCLSNEENKETVKIARVKKNTRQRVKHEVTQDAWSSDED
ncbi:DNA excision repair protein ERCC-8 isoform X2 [Cherax quadricarinatus]|uniref:DNA excision repair protein ERCC-8 isoform X2 n=1 Tax=Cherax quadricarinatus TaxID=27406 RepID=UPI0023797FD1|nr:DNA excision repair protein ERCC-8-like isoform X2 [Cherax quadricarinatus]